MVMGKVVPGLDEEGRALVERLGGRWTGSGGMCRCPAHDDRNPSLSVRPGRTRMLLHCFAGCDVRDVLRALVSSGAIRGEGAQAQPIGRRGPDDRRREAALGIWSQSRPLAGTLAERYLEGRGLAGSPELRFHPRTPHGQSPFTQYRPALIAAVRDDTGIVAIHRTFLDAEGRSLGRTSERRCGLGRFGRGAVRLGGTGPSLGLAEGVETALSASAMFGVPCWATVGTERFGRVAIPRDVERLLLFLDHDPGGRRAEALARNAFPRLRCEAHVPPRAGEDWNDVLVRRIIAGCPAGLQSAPEIDSGNRLTNNAVHRGRSSADPFWMTAAADGCDRGKGGVVPISNQSLERPFRKRGRAANALAISALLMSSGCASHLIRSAEAEPVGNAGQPFRHTSTSIGGQRGLSTDGAGYVTRDTCRSADLAEVEVRRNFAQTLVTLLTLGFVSPVTFHYLCEKPEPPQPPPPCDCPSDEL